MTTSYNVGDKVEYNPQASYYLRYDGTEGVVIGIHPDGFRILV